MRTKRVVVTGATGMIAATLIDYLSQRGIEVFAICRPGSKKISNIIVNEYIHIIECDIDDLLSLNAKIKVKCDIFFHFGWDGTFANARDDAALQCRNIKDTLDAIELAYLLKCQKFIGAGSQAEYGITSSKLSSSITANPITGYGIAKYAAGKLGLIRCKQLNMKFNWARILSVYGPYDNNHTLIMSTIIKMVNNERVKFTKGEQEWDYTFSKDIAKAFYLIAENGMDGKTYILGTGVTRKLKEYIEIIGKEILPNQLLKFGEVPYNENQVMHLCANIEELENDTGFVPEYTFETGICETIDWYKTRCENEKN
ncbi:MAG: NAD(P)-dependent oxidoreductase [Erysipelotrichaceae bacterium]